MLDIKDFAFLENTQSSFDFKGFLLKLLSYWKWFVLSLIITFTIAYNVNIRKEKIYGMESLIVVKDENNPFLPQIQVWFLIGEEFPIKCKR